jgi:hypothetical protein
MMAFVHILSNSLLFTIIQLLNAIQPAVLTTSLNKTQRCNKISDIIKTKFGKQTSETKIRMHIMTVKASMECNSKGRNLDTSTPPYAFMSTGTILPYT